MNYCGAMTIKVLLFLLFIPSIQEPSAICYRFMLLKGALAPFASLILYLYAVPSLYVVLVAVMLLVFNLLVAIDFRNSIHYSSALAFASR
jgi:hypothetical protein